jgi:thiol-disulfide isomerase/thioredoxin
MVVSLSRRRALAVLAFATLVGGCGASTPPPTVPSPLIDKPLPGFKRRTLSGTAVSTKDTGRRVTVVKFFAEYCEPCKKTLPAAQALHMQRPDLLIIGIAEDEYQQAAQGLVDSFGLTFPVIHDRGNILAGRFRVSELPRTFVADRKGNIRWVDDGSRGEDALEAAIEWIERQRATAQ